MELEEVGCIKVEFYQKVKVSVCQRRWISSNMPQRLEFSNLAHEQSKKLSLHTTTSVDPSLWIAILLILSSGWESSLCCSIVLRPRKESTVSHTTSTITGPRLPLNSFIDQEVRVETGCSTVCTELSLDFLKAEGLILSTEKQEKNDVVNTKLFLLEVRALFNDTLKSVIILS